MSFKKNLNREFIDSVFYCIIIQIQIYIFIVQQNIKKSAIYETYFVIIYFLSKLLKFPFLIQQTKKNQQNLRTYIRLSMYLVNRLRMIPASFRSPRPIMSSIPSIDVGCMCLIAVFPSNQISFPSSSITCILPEWVNFTRPPIATSNSPFFSGSNQTWSPYNGLQIINYISCT